MSIGREERPLEVLQSKLDSILELLQGRNGDAPRPDTTNSSQLNELFAALAKAQAEMTFASLNKENPYFKSRYSDLKEVIASSRPALSKHGLAVIQKILTNDEGQSILHTMLCHSSGQWIESRMRIVPPKNDIQTLGSYVTYLRRYSLAALIGIASQDEDDDGEIAMAEARHIVAKGPSSKYDPKRQSYETITREQLEELEYELDEYPDIAEQVLEGLKIMSLADMPKDRFKISLERIRQIKSVRNGK